MAVRTSTWFPSLVAAIILAVPSAASAAPGALDTRFDGDGIAEVAGTGKLFSVGIASVQQPDGAVLVGGARTSIGLELDDEFAFDFRVHPAVTRYRPDGTIDAAWGDKGIAKLYLQNHLSMVTTMASQPDGSTLVAGVNVGLLSLTTFIARLDAHGRLDESFGAGGFVTSLPEDLTLLAPLAVNALPDGRITTAGISLSGDLLGFDDRKRKVDVDLVVQRYLPNGAVDRSFGRAGRADVDSNGTDSLDIPVVARIAHDGAVLSGGIALNDALTYGRSLIMRVGAEGTVDRSFASGGVAMGPARTGQYDIVTALADMADGSTVQGITQFSDEDDAEDGVRAVYVRRMGATGQSMPVAGATSVVRVPGTQLVTALLPLADGRIVLAGQAFDDFGDLSNPAGVVARITTAGKLDQGFDRSGLARLTSADDELRMTVPAGVHPGPDGTILVPGTYSGQSGIARLYGDSSAGAGRRATAVSMRVTRTTGGATCGGSEARPCVLDGRIPGTVQLRIATRGVPVGTMLTVKRDFDDYGYWEDGLRVRVPVRPGGIAVVQVTDVRFTDEYFDEEEGEERVSSHAFRVEVPATASSLSVRSRPLYLRVDEPLDRPETDDDDEFDLSRPRTCARGTSLSQVTARIACAQLDDAAAIRGDTRTRIRRWLGR